ncbi:MAG: MerR family transcriptional regulator, partial [Bacteroidota bacterium]
MNHFSIKDIENLTGIKSHTLRIWEQRYGIPHPKRTSTNIRYYDGDDLKLLLNVSMLNRNGFKISKLTKLSKDELEKMAFERALTDLDADSQVDAMIAAMFSLDCKSLISPLASTSLLAAFIPVLTLALSDGPRMMFDGRYVVDDFSLVIKGLFLLAGYVVVLLSADYLRD